MAKTSRLATLVAVFFSLVLHAQQGTTVRGRVTIASDGSPLPGATVSIDELHLSTVTDAEGRFQIPVTSGRAGQTVKVSAALQGFQTRTATATLVPPRSRSISRYAFLSDRRSPWGRAP